MPKPLDFNKVESLRKHMLLNAGQMAKALGTTRVTYAGWTKGKPIRPTNEERVRQLLRVMLRVMTTHTWPDPSVIAMAPKQRLDTLLEYMGETE